jgi:hypothetical protein
MAKIFHSLTDSLTVLSDLFRGFSPLSPLWYSYKRPTGCLATGVASWNIQLVYTDIDIRTSLWSLVTTYFQTKDSNRLQQSWAGLSMLNEKFDQLLTLGTVSSGKNGSADDDATTDHTRGISERNQLMAKSRDSVFPFKRIS